MYHLMSVSVHVMIISMKGERRAMRYDTTARMYMYFYRNSPKSEMPKEKTYNTRYSLVVTDPTTNPALPGLTMGEQTGPRILHELWSYVIV